MLKCQHYIGLSVIGLESLIQSLKFESYAQRKYANKKWEKSQGETTKSLKDVECGKRKWSIL